MKEQVELNRFQRFVRNKVVIAGAGVALGVGIGLGLGIELPVSNPQQTNGSTPTTSGYEGNPVQTEAETIFKSIHELGDYPIDSVSSRTDDNGIEYWDISWGTKIDQKTFEHNSGKTVISEKTKGIYSDYFPHTVSSFPIEVVTIPEGETAHITFSIPFDEIFSSTDLEILRYNLKQLEQDPKSKFTFFGPKVTIHLTEFELQHIDGQF